MAIKQIKFVRILLIIFGGAISLFALVGIILDLLLYFIDNSFAYPVDNYIIFMLIPIIIGLIYLFIGIYFIKMTKWKLPIHIVLSIVLICWFIPYFIYHPGLIQNIIKFNPDLPISPGIIIVYFQRIFLILLVLIFQMIIGRKLYKIKGPEKTEV